MHDASSTADSTHRTKTSPKRWWVIALIAVVIVAVLFFAGRELASFLPSVTRWVESLGAAAPVLFVLVYAAAAILLVPVSVLTIAAGATFGIWKGAGLVVVGAALGAVASFVIARYVARDRVAARLAADPRLEEIDRAVGESGFRIMFLMRLSPAFPFALQNYALGLTRVRCAHYAAALVAMLPGTLLYVYSGAVAREVAAAAGTAPARTPAYYAVLVLGLVATIAVTVIITRLARRSLKSHASGAAQRTALRQSSKQGSSS
ncbi:MAG: TVP38/TMEM64 family protein [Gemmatimonas sp.]